MITLKASRFIVAQDEHPTNGIDYKVYIRNRNGFEDITASLTDEEQKELISDLIYCVSDLLKKQNSKESSLESQEEMEME